MGAARSVLVSQPYVWDRCAFFGKRLKDGSNLERFEDRTFVFLVIAVTLAFFWILWPFFGAILWGTILAIMFAPFFRRVLRTMPKRRTGAALLTVMLVLLI